MSGYYNQSDDSFEESMSTGGGLRKMLEDALSENRKLLDKLNQRERGRTTAELLKDKGLDPAIADIIPSDTDPAQWVEKYAHLLGTPRNEEPQMEEPAAEPELQLADDSDPALVAEREALAAMHDAQESGSNSVISKDVLEQMNKINSEEEFVKFLRENS